ncbi:Alpha/Beta hydrolase protein [Amylocarpus encephaloides]|uniref:feruloyl esterase n=1 Tax=Amylocarpus encephaloides TaxID=45428 RepID=A0A9P7YAB0_9HELO|nr:Alpha/Beta hydrolase protein [Amylocarpus encephaloides]
MRDIISYLLAFGGLAQDPQEVLWTQPATGNIEYTLDTERTFLLNVPRNYSHGEPYPLVLSFHGAGGFSEKQQRITELSDPSLSIAGKPFLTAYPQGVNNTDWNMTHIWKGALYENKTVDDIAYVYDIISAISATYSVDTSRIYACGKSNGGGFTALLACRPDTSSIFAAFAPPVPILHTHGIEDIITPFYGRPDPKASPFGFGTEPDVRVWRREWTERNGCRGGFGGAWPEPSIEEVHPGTWEEVWDCPGAEVRSLTVEGMGHAWPSTLGLDLAGRSNQTTNFNFTNQHLVQFFSRHKLP